MSRLVGTWTLTRLALRRDRLLLPVWILVFPLFTVSSTSATLALYPDEASRVEAASAINDLPVGVALYGRIWDPTSLGALSLLKLAAMGGVMIGILAIMLVTRHARAEEEKGRTELIGASVVGSWAGLTAAMIVTTMAMVAIGILSALGLTAAGLPAGGSWAFGLAWTTTGLAFAAVSAIANQVTVSARAANALTVNGLAHLVLVPNPPHQARGDFLLANGEVRADIEVEAPAGNEQVCTFSGIGIYRPQLFADIQRGQPAKLAPLLRAAMDTGGVSGELHAGRWIDVGTPQRLADLDAELRSLSREGAPSPMQEHGDI